MKRKHPEDETFLEALMAGLMLCVLFVVLAFLFTLLTTTDANKVNHNQVGAPAHHVEPLRSA